MDWMDRMKKKGGELKTPNKRLSFKELAAKILKESKSPLTGEEIWENAKIKKYDKLVNSSGKTPWRSISAQLYTESLSERSKFKRVSNGKFGLRANEYNNRDRERKSTKTKNSKKELEERNLHPLLVYFLHSDSHFRCYSKTIYHEKSKGAPKGKNEWIHPDIVAVHFTREDYSNEILKIQQSIGKPQVKLYSFEMKITINIIDLKKSYFQALSNSSWANEGYLVCLNIADEELVNRELLRLNQMFGIGIIRLNLENIEQSEILIPAKYKDEIDIETMNILTEINDDFKEFLETVNRNINDSNSNSKKISIKDSFDIIEDEKNIRKLIENKKIEKLLVNRS